MQDIEWTIRIPLTMKPDKLLNFEATITEAGMDFSTTNKVQDAYNIEAFYQRVR